MKKTRLDEALECLQFCEGAIRDAIYCEDGLDGSAGETVLKWIRKVLRKNKIKPIHYKSSEDTK